MPHYVALLRSVNVAGHGRIAMAELKASFATLGYTDISTFIQTGNVIFRTPSKNTTKLATDIEQQLATDFGSSPAVILRTVRDLLRIGSSSPFANRGADPARHHVTFLAHAPSTDRLRAFSPPPSGRDELVVDGLEIYVNTPDGYATTKLTGTYVERHLGVTTTTRNWNTVTKLCQLIAE
jgi:uncharacterized protein (DUF1697 family)